MASKLSVTQLYKDLCKKYKALYQVDDKFIRQIEEINIKHKEINRTRRIIAAITIALFFFSYTPSLLKMFFDFAKIAEIQLANILDIRDFLRFHQEVYISLLFLSVAIPLYTLVLPWMSLEQLKIFILSPKTFTKKFQLPKRRGSPLVNLKKKNLTFIIYTVTLYYFAFWGLIALGYSNNFISRDFMRPITIVWLMISALPFSILPAVILFALLISILAYIEFKRERSVKPELIIIEMLKLIKQVDEANNNTYISLQDRKLIADTINSVSGLIRRIYFRENSPNPIDDWANEKMNKVAVSFQSLGAKVLMPKENNLSNILSDIIPYLNAFLKVNYFDFPQETHDNLITSNITQKHSHSVILNFIFLTIYMTMPVIVVGILTDLFDLEIIPVIQTLLSILYAAWIIFGALYFSEKLRPDFRSWLIDILRAIIPK